MAEAFTTPSHSKFQDLTGRRFSMWRVESYAGARGPHHYWNCVCDCGKAKPVAMGSLTRGLSGSCGCRAHEKTAKRWGNHRLTVPQCSADGCIEKSHANGLCKLHYERVRKGNGIGESRTTRSKKSRWVRENVHYANDDCLIWPFSVSDHGRGSLQVDGVIMSAPKYMCTLAHGEAPTPHHETAHSCGKGHLGCMSPRHLSWKTPVENEADKIIHGTLRKGRDINTNKLTEQQVIEIRRRAASETGVSLAEEFSVSTTQISNIKNRKSWAWL